MSRRRITNQRRIFPDPRFGSEVVAKFINIIMKNGKKSIAEKIVYTALDMLSEFSKKEAIESFESCLKKVKPIIEVKSRRVGGSTYQVPVEIRPIRQNTLAMRWIIESARKRKEKSMGFRIAHEFFDIMENKGLAIKKREDMHRTADANKAFAHYKW